MGFLFVVLVMSSSSSRHCKVSTRVVTTTGVSKQASNHPNFKTTTTNKFCVISFQLMLFLVLLICWMTGFISWKYIFLIKIFLFLSNWEIVSDHLECLYGRFKRQTITSLLKHRTSHLDACIYIWNMPMHHLHTHIVLELSPTGWVKLEPKFCVQILHQ